MQTKRTQSFSILSCFLLMILVVSSCRDIEPQSAPPTVTMSEQSYSVKPNRNLLIQPAVENAGADAVYSWTMNGKVIGTSKDLLFNKPEVGTYYVKFKVVTLKGTAQSEVEVNVTNLEPPLLSFPDGDNIILENGESYTFTPHIANKEDLKMKWIENDQVVSTDTMYTYTPTDTGASFIHVIATNADGEDDYLIKVTVIDQVPIEVSFEYPQQAMTVGRRITLTPEVTNLLRVQFTWYVDGKEVEHIDQESSTDPVSSIGGNTTTTSLRGKETKPMIYSFGKNNEYLSYLTSTVGEQEVKVVAKKGSREGSSTLKIVANNPDQYYRAPTASSDPHSTKVFKFLPAPGQFVNERYVANTMEEATAYAEAQLKQTRYVSLGAFGGYIVVGFDHSIKNSGDYDFAIAGNSFNGSSEPGIVWVMQDVNGNGLPDDTWYELRGSETGKEGTIQDYVVTYYRNSVAHTDVVWTDNHGQKGSVEVNNFHNQDSYYPLWVKPNTYILRGTRLKSTSHDTSGNGTYWVNPEKEWGYVDNYSPIDRLTNDENYNAGANNNYFKISNAMTHDLQPVHLKYIDFIKVQSGMLFNSGWLGEISTEVFKFTDIHVQKND